MTQHDPSKRRFIKAATYVAPAILTLSVVPTIASAGSGRWHGNPESPGEQPGNTGGEPSTGGGDYIGGEQPAGGSSSSYASYTPRKKKRKWYWPFS